MIRAPKTMYGGKLVGSSNGEPLYELGWEHANGAKFGNWLVRIGLIREGRSRRMRSLREEAREALSGMSAAASPALVRIYAHKYRRATLAMAKHTIATREVRHAILCARAERRLLTFGEKWVSRPWYGATRGVV